VQQPRSACNGASITLCLSCNGMSPPEQQVEETERLSALAAWLWREGHHVTALRIQLSRQEQGNCGESCIPAIVAALAAAGKRPGGLRLEQLALPALGNTPLPTISAALSGCRHLKALDLSTSGNSGTSGFFAGRCTNGWDLLAALVQLTQLTSLRLDGGLFGYMKQDDPLHEFGCPPADWECWLPEAIARLPRSLVVLDWGSPGELPISSLSHLTALQKLTLSAEVTISGSDEDDSSDRHAGMGSSSGDSGGMAAASCKALPALTHLTYPLALKGQEAAAALALLQPGNLVELQAVEDQNSTLDARACPRAMQLLVANTRLRSLGLEVHMQAGPAAGPLQAQLTGLTSLRLTGYDVRFGYPEPAVCLPWAKAIGALTGLRRLAVAPCLLGCAPWGSLTALTRLELFPQEVGYGEHVPPPLDALRSLAGGSLQQVVLPASGRLGRLPAFFCCCLQRGTSANMCDHPTSGTQLRDSCRTHQH
jgi:hypothetical protein